MWKAKAHRPCSVAPQLRLFNFNKKIKIKNTCSLAHLSHGQVFPLSNHVQKEKPKAKQSE